MSEAVRVKEALYEDELRQYVKRRLRDPKHQKLGPSRFPSPLHVNLQLQGTGERDDHRW